MECSPYPAITYPSNSQRLVFLLDPLKIMFSIMDHYIAMFDRVGEMDRPYLYNERATLSIFANAAAVQNPYKIIGSHSPFS